MKRKAKSGDIASFFAKKIQRSTQEGKEESVRDEEEAGSDQEEEDDREEEGRPAIPPGPHGMFLFFFHINCHTVG